MEAALRWIPVAGCAVGAIYLAMALTASHELVQAARATIAIGVAVVPWLAARAVRELLTG
jgi:hypothetical protein